jgi:hypothetical protein
MAVVQVVLNNNVAVINHVICVCEEEQQLIQEKYNAILTPNQDYRHFPRKPKCLFHHNEALYYICSRDNFGIEGDLTTPIFKDRTLEMMFRLSRSRAQRVFKYDMNAHYPF